MTTTKPRVPYAYLTTQFDPDSAIVEKVNNEIEQLHRHGQYTLGPELQLFEQEWARVCGTEYAVGVANGTDAIKMGLRAVGVEGGDEVITQVNTFPATVGAILEIGAIPVLIDCDENQLPNITSAAVALTAKTKAFVPVWWAGNMGQYGDWGPPSGVPIVEDACQAIGASSYGVQPGQFGDVAAFSLHPLKNVNVWGDGGMIATNNGDIANEIKMLRNHGFADRDTWTKPGYNSRLDTLQAIVGLHTLGNLDWATRLRIDHANTYDAGFAPVEQIRIPKRDPNVKHVYHLYTIFVDRRDELIQYLAEQGIEAKVHYPVPLHLQPALKFLAHRKGDFPVAEHLAETIISLPVHEYLTEGQIEYTIETINEFYR